MGLAEDTNRTQSVPEVGFALMKRWAFLATGALVICASIPTAAQAVAPEDCNRTHGLRHSVPIVIRGWVGEPETFRAGFRIAAGRSNATFSFIPSDLRAEITRRIDRTLAGGEITIDELEEVTSGDIVYVGLAVTAVPSAGKFRGTIEMRRNDERCTLPIRVVAKARPELAVSAAPIIIKVVDCSELSCFWGTGILESRAGLTYTKEEVRLRVHVRNAADSRALSRTTIRLRDSRGHTLAASGDEPPVELIPEFLRIRAHGFAPMAITATRNQIDPGKYVGAIVLMPDGGAEVVVPFELLVKAGPFWAIITILGALALLAIARLSRSFTLHRQALSSVKLLRKEAQAVLSESSRKIIYRQLALSQHLALNNLIAPATRELEAIVARIKALHRGEQLVDLARRKSGGAIPPEIAADLQTLRLSVEHREPATRLEEIIVALDAKVKNIPVPAAATGGALGMPPPAVVKGPPPQERARAVMRLTLIRMLPPFLHAAIALALLSLGLEALYFNNDTFGAHIVRDYGALAIWGIASDFVSSKVKGLLPNALPGSAA